MDFIPSLIVALGLVCLIESLPWVISPEKTLEFYRELGNLIRPEKMRVFGVVLLLVAIVLVWYGKNLLR